MYFSFPVRLEADGQRIKPQLTVYFLPDVSCRGFPGVEFRRVILSILSKPAEVDGG
jgi:hypothetical protein